MLGGPVPESEGGDPAVVVVEFMIWLSGLCLLLYVGLLILVTVGLHTSPRWDAALAEAARLAERSLGIVEGDYSTSEASALAELRRLHLAAVSQKPEGPDDLDVICALLNLPRTEELAAGVVEEREAQLDAAVARHRRYFARVRPIRWRVKMWHLAGAVSTAQRVIRAVRWLAPRVRFLVSEGNQAIGRLIAIVSIVALIVISLTAGPLSGSRPTNVLAMFGVATSIATIAGVFVPVVASVRRLHALLRKSVRFWVASVGLVVVVVVLERIINSAAWAHWQQAQLSRIDGIDLETGAPRVVVWVTCVGGLLWAAWRAACWVRVRSVRRSERVAAVASASVLAVMAAFAAFVSVGAAGYAHASALMLAVIALLGSLAWCAVATLEWVSRLRGLSRVGIQVRRGWFRWWALAVWAASVLVLEPAVTGLAGIDTSGAPPAIQAIFAVVTVLTASSLTLGLLAATVIGVIVTTRYVRRVDRVHRAAQATTGLEEEDCGRESE